ncbi:Mitochondrial uncoupling protein 4 [Lamellibrachia satsuma]|nr:Mitochondrial uncoupling protein 4 [Lamellibrachia satsuma]
MLSGLTAGGVAQFIASPTDLVKIHMQMEGRLRLEGHPPRVKNTWHAFSRIFQEGGVRGLWKGWTVNVQRAALVNLGELTTYDTVKHQILKYTKLEDTPLTHALSSVCSGLVAATVGTPADVIKTRFMNQAVKDGKESSPQPWRRLRGGKVTGRKEMGRRETGQKEMEMGGKTSESKERGVGETVAKETGGRR